MFKESIALVRLQEQLHGALSARLPEDRLQVNAALYGDQYREGVSVTVETRGNMTQARSTTLADFQRAHAELLLAPLCEIPPHARHQVRRGLRFEGPCIIFFESWPPFRSRSQWRDHPIAKFRWVKNRRVWQLFCVLRDLKWHRYERMAESPDLAELVAEVRADPTGIFFG